MKLSHKFFIANVIVVLLAVAATSSLGLYEMRKEFIRKASVDLEARMKTFHQLLKFKGAELRVADGKLKQGDYVINDNFELPDSIKDIFGGAATIFMGDVRVSTNVTKPDGSRAVGTKLQGPAYDAVIREGKPYRGAAPILGVPYFTAYDPLKNAAGEVVGVLYVGEKQSEYLAVYDRLKYVTAAVAALLAGLFSFLSFLFVRRALQPLGRMVALMHDIALGEGDLTVRLNITANDEIGEAAGYFDRFVDKLQAVIRKVADSTHDVAAASADLHDTATQIATGTEELASQAATVSTSGEEMAATSHNIADNCNAAAGNSHHASTLATSGAGIVMQTVEGMQRIAARVQETARQVAGLGARSDEVGAIVGTIEDIADQTNLLALNAAIEAARAGEQGRGFAVVADEVRALAERTTRATKEIAGMIRAIQGETRTAVDSMEAGVREVEAGTTEAARSGSALQEILDQVNEVTGQINQIATAAEQQSSTSSEISNNMHQITEVINATAQSTHDTTRAADKLAHLADELSKLVGQFKLS
ncbi:methyl-accepting chemotaxis protein [Oryzomonas rubra]|uniref:Methyl-accepting chemotaxis protein n=1 Tax=Oryzomonas rubra TaxID=2509454 RepID=A0A5A9XP49_9BACT|nr:methyl-accepting chemotaxis protein [Oryzomonas rubra]KAA0894018.1 methyl-accepting chemotaxis protein [Oryzomonas rubra]